ncbi:MAG: hypothetical protein AAGA93_21715 [Actinomycetota bacterium]
MSAADRNQVTTTDGGSTEPNSGEPCDLCGDELSVIRIVVDGNTLLMESCDGCDTRRWQLAGERIDLQQALDEVGEHAGRRR